MTTAATPIAAARAEVKVATVEVRTLTVDGRSLSRGLFRQIPRGQFAAWLGEEGIEPWGLVDYYWAESPNVGGQCAHIVGTIEGELRRQIVAPIFPRLAERLREGREPKSDANGIAIGHLLSDDVTVQLWFLQDALRGLGEHRAEVHKRRPDWVKYPHPNAVDWALREKARASKLRGDPWPLAEDQDAEAILRDVVRVTTGRLDAAIAEHRAAWVILAELPQLYIAT